MLETTNSEEITNWDCQVRSRVIPGRTSAFIDSEVDFTIKNTRNLRVPVEDGKVFVFECALATSSVSFDSVKGFCCVDCRPINQNCRSIASGYVNSFID